MTAERNISATDIRLSEITHIYFIGIGGIGMSALARYFKQIGKTVSGYDKTETALTKALISEGIPINYSDNVKALPSELIETDLSHALVIFTPAVPSTHTQLNHLRTLGFSTVKRSVALGLIVSNSKGLAVAGTHGKTTTSSILAHLIHQSETPVSAFLGGIATNFNSNFIHSEGAELTVVEADEFDRSFLTLHPFGAIITSTDADHLDIYGESDSLLESFKAFAAQASDVLLIHEGVAEHFCLPLSARVKTYGWRDTSDYQITSRIIENGSYVISIKTPEGILQNVKFHMPGKHNSENALAALALARETGIDAQELAKGLDTFKGIKRRFETLVNNSEHVYIDDYAHHPIELNAAIAAAKELYPTKKLTGIFQPHLYSRTRDFADEFARSLSALDELILLDIYPAREEPIEGITSDWLLSSVATQKQLLSKEESLSWIDTHRPELLMTLGAGDIDQLVNPIKTLLS
ncbi:MAG: UDP-N-acetylmuramate--L-alanine ligase [Flavobacteriales bacterium]